MWDAQIVGMVRADWDVMRAKYLGNQTALDWVSARKKKRVLGVFGSG